MLDLNPTRTSCGIWHLGLLRFPVPNPKRDVGFNCTVRPDPVRVVGVRSIVGGAGPNDNVELSSIKWLTVIAMS